MTGEARILRNWMYYSEDEDIEDTEDEDVERDRKRDIERYEDCQCYFSSFFPQEEIGIGIFQKAHAIEGTFLVCGAVSGKDYNVVDLFKIAVEMQKAEDLANLARNLEDLKSIISDLKRSMTGSMEIL